MNFHNLRRLFMLNSIFNLEYMVKNGLMIIDLKKFVLFPELNFSTRLDTLRYISDMKCLGNNVIKIKFQYSDELAHSPSFSSTEEALEYMEFLTFFVNLLCAVPKKS